MRIWWSYIVRSIRIILPAVLIASLFSTQIVEILFGSNYAEAGPLFAMACLSTLIFAIDPELLLRSKGYARSLTLIHSLSLVAFSLVFLLPAATPLDILLARLLTEAGACGAKYFVVYFEQWSRSYRVLQSSAPRQLPPELAT
jgi:O-antigen/teichoic acid export membrane protein